MRSLPRLRVSTLVAGFVLGSALLALGAVVPTIIGASHAAVERQATGALRTTARAVSAALARSLYVQWREVQALGAFAVAGEPVGALRLRMETVKAVNDRYAWIGIAEPGGTVVAATGGVLQGTSVAQRGWFSGGLAGPFAGDVHEAVLLKEHLASADGELPRLIDLAAPLRKATGEEVGVIAAHVSWPWFRNLVRDQARENGLDVMLVARDGTVLVGPPELDGTRLATRSALAARQGAALTALEAWPDGVSYLVSVVPGLSYRDLPGFGWSLVVRQRTEAAFAPVRAITSRLLPVGAVTIALLVAAALAFGRYLGRPITGLAKAAAAMAAAPAAPDSPVSDERSYAEVAELSSALARLQGAVMVSGMADALAAGRNRRFGHAA